jgi:hypothetical protein
MGSNTAESNMAGYQYAVRVCRAGALHGRWGRDVDAALRLDSNSCGSPPSRLHRELLASGRQHTRIEWHTDKCARDRLGVDLDTGGKPPGALITQDGRRAHHGGAPA